jgi:hypothetical protein
LILDIFWMLLLQLVLIALNAVFACAEIAVINIGEAKLTRLAGEGDKRAKRLARLTKDPSRFLATIQVAITLAGFLGSAFAAENFSDRLVNWVISLGVTGVPHATLDALAVMRFERAEPTVVMGELSRTLCDMQIVRLYLDAGKGTAEIAALLKMHEYKTGLLVKAVAGVNPARLSRAVALCTEADAAVKLSSGSYAPIEKLICSL